MVKAKARTKKFTKPLYTSKIVLLPALFLLFAAILFIALIQRSAISHYKNISDDAQVQLSMMAYVSEVGSLLNKETGGGEWTREDGCVNMGKLERWRCTSVASSDASGRDMEEVNTLVESLGYRSSRDFLTGAEDESIYRYNLANDVACVLSQTKDRLRFSCGREAVQSVHDSIRYTYTSLR